MLIDEIKRGVETVSDSAGLDVQEVDRMATAIAQQAVSSASGSHALTLNPTSGQLIWCDLFKAITGAAGVAGVVLTAVAGVTLPATLAAVAALGSLQGVRKRAPSGSGQLVVALLAAPSRKLPRSTLASEVNRPEDFDRAIDFLDQVGCVRLESDEVVLIEKIVIRF
ncbi:hypothetical protein GCM10009557_15430 [Virgisporangium ochraceum]|uniref:Uncharacterized protein n=1 Tax=Virgisporangium ochraceum TaxID=65505 RepID=A0A8J3ZPS0_9ACTN|nr:hypothetical protein [Virgisporangium ochraceum]GIJ67937.1 hypothetical protein Voc01_028540 [Virgisporangium ochraceum]